MLGWQVRELSIVLTILGQWQGGPILLPFAAASKVDDGNGDEATALDNSDNALNMMDTPEAGAELETAGAARAAVVLKQNSVMDFARYFRRV
jgi:hypothetical protein